MIPIQFDGLRQAAALAAALGIAFVAAGCGGREEIPLADVPQVEGPSSTDGSTDESEQGSPDELIYK